MIRLLLLLLVSCAAILPARAALTPNQLAKVELAPPLGARLPPGLQFAALGGGPMTIAQALDGRPGLVIFADYTCNSLCGPALALAAGALDGFGLKPDEYRLVVLPLDPRDGAADARAMMDRIGETPAVAGATRVLLGDAHSVDAATRAVGYHAVYDAEHDQFAHPTGALVVTRDGDVSRSLSNFALDPDSLRLALVEAGQGRTGGVVDQLRLLCYGFDAAHGVYTASVYRALAIGSGITVLAVGTAILLLRRRELRRHGAES